MLGKSYLVAVYCCAKCILFPGIRIIVAAKDKSQAKLLITQKIEKELMSVSDALRSEIKEIRSGSNDALVKFHNGSTIECCVSGESARGYRCHVLICDEFRLIPKEIQDKILRPFLTVVRRPPFHNKSEYKNYPVEENKEIYMSSAYYKFHDSYLKFKSYLNAMCSGKPYFCCDLSYETAMESGLLTEARVDAIRNEDDMNEISFLMEMCGVFYGESETAFYKLDDIQPCRRLYKGWVSPSKETVLLEKEKKKKSYWLPKQSGEVRLIGADIALMGGSENDNSIFTMIRLLPDGDKYLKHVVAIESCEGSHSESQAIRLKQLYNDFQADTIVLDTQGNGISVYDAMAKVQYDSDRDEEYPPFIAFNNEKMSIRSLEKNGIPCIYSVKVATSEVNHQICTWLKDEFQNKRLKLLINDLEAKSYLIEKNDFHLKQPEEQAMMLKPYVQTTALVNELVNLEWKSAGMYIKVYEVARNRKDRFSSLGYAIWYSRLLEKDLKKKDKSTYLPCLW